MCLPISFFIYISSFTSVFFAPLLPFYKHHPIDTYFFLKLLFSLSPIISCTLTIEVLEFCLFIVEPKLLVQLWLIFIKFLLNILRKTELLGTCISSNLRNIFSLLDSTSKLNGGLNQIIFFSSFHLSFVDSFEV